MCRARGRSHHWISQLKWKAVGQLKQNRAHILKIKINRISNQFEAIHIQWNAISFMHIDLQWKRFEDLTYILRDGDQ